jgi:miniconductance mechanosensitive channel
LFKGFWEREGVTLVAEHKESLSNVRLFRSYLSYYLQRNPLVHSDLAIYVRNQEIADKGLPIQILFYSKKTQTRDFEEVQADVLEHAFSVISSFYLVPYQSFSGRPPMVV